MFYYIPQIIFFIALALIFWLLIKNFPKIKKLNVSEMIGNIEDEFDELTASGKRILKNVHIEKVDAQVNGLLEKVLRRLKINTIKFDSHLQQAIDSIKKKSTNKDKLSSNAIFKSEEDEENVDNLELKTKIKKKKEKIN